jgi:hypothetical protein
MVSETVEFRGLQFHRYPYSKFRVKREYYRHGQRGILLHRAVWEYHNGPIPKGMAIHHIDGNADNNAIENLECVDYHIHGAFHAGEASAIKRHGVCVYCKKPFFRQNTAKYCSNRCLSKISVERRSVKHTCAWCRVEFSAVSSRARLYCSPGCSTTAKNVGRARYQVVSRSCPSCNGVFHAKENSKKRCCSRSCARRWGGKNRFTTLLSLDSDSLGVHNKC